jgi:Protein kinase domain/Trypsin
VSLGASVGRYVVLEEVGRGGMGRVLRAYDPKLQREVALKEVHGDMLGPEGAPRLVAEARAMAKLSPPNVVALYDVQEPEPDRVVLVMEYISREQIASKPMEGTTCQADGGSPLVLDTLDGPRLVGVASEGTGCASPSSPQIYTRVSSYLEWIDSEVG